MMRTSALLLALIAACNGGGSSAPDGGGGGACTLVGTWHFAPKGTTILSTFVASADGTSTVQAGSGPAQPGTWKLDHDTIQIAETSSTQSSCGVGVVGTYTLTFAPDCHAVTFTLVSDACAGRAQVVNGVTLTR